MLVTKVNQAEGPIFFAKKNSKCLGIFFSFIFIYIPLDQKSQKSTQKRTQKSNRAQKRTQKSNEAQKSTQKSKFTQKSTQKSNELKKELKKVK